MSKLVLPKATASARTAATPAAGEILYDQTEKKLYYGDGITQGGVKLAYAAADDAYVYGVDINLSKSSPGKKTTANPQGSHEKVTLNFSHDSAGDSLRYTKLTESESFSQMPCHNLRRCVMNMAARTVSYYLNASDSTKKTDGTAADLTGNDGEVMVEFPVGYYRIDSYTYTPEGGSIENHIVKLISDKPFSGAAPFPAFYTSGGGATLQAQYMGAFKAFIGSDSMCHSVTGIKPTVGRTRVQFRTAAAANNGTNTNFLLKIWLSWLAEIEYGSNDVQSTVSRGFSELSSYDSVYLRECGRTVSLGNGTGQITADATTPGFTLAGSEFAGIIYERYPSGDADNRKAWKDTASSTVLFTDKEYTALAVGDTAYPDSTSSTAYGTVFELSTPGKDYDLEGHWNSGAAKIVSFSYRGVEDPWGACWEFDDGIQKYQDATAGDYTKSGYWFTNDTSKYTQLDTDKGYGTANTPFPSEGYTGADVKWVSQSWPKAEGYIKLYDTLTCFPTDVTGSSTTYLCDNFDNDAAAGGCIVLRGGGASTGYDNGAYCIDVTFSVSDTTGSGSVGSRLAI